MTPWLFALAVVMGTAVCVAATWAAAAAAVQVYDWWRYRSDDDV